MKSHDFSSTCQKVTCVTKTPGSFPLVCTGWSRISVHHHHYERWVCFTHCFVNVVLLILIRYIYGDTILWAFLSQEQSIYIQHTFIRCTCVTQIVKVYRKVFQYAFTNPLYESKHSACCLLVSTICLIWSFIYCLGTWMYTYVYQ